MPTVRVQLSQFSGASDLTLWLYNSGSLLNTGGDSLVETGSTGSFTASVAETISTDLVAVVKQAGVAVYDDFLHLGNDEIGLGRGVLIQSVAGTVVSRTAATKLQAFVGEQLTHTISTVDADGNAVDCSGLTLEVVIESLSRTDILVISNASIAKTITTVAFTVGESYHKNEKNYRWALRRTDTGVVIMYGPYVIEHAPHQDEA